MLTFFHDFIFNSGRFIANYHGPQFELYIKKVINVSEPVIIMMGGVCTDCGMEYFKLATVYGKSTDLRIYNCPK